MLKLLPYHTVVRLNFLPLLHPSTLSFILLHFACKKMTSELPAWPNGYSARQLKLLANPLALGRVRIQEASKNRQQFFL